MLKDREKMVLEFLKSEIATKGYPPTVREIGAALGIKSISTVHADLTSLTKKGYLKKDPAKPRTLVIVDKDEPSMHFASDAFASGLENENVIDVPIVGRVAAGTPILATENIESSFPIPAAYASGGTHFMLRVKGESMIEAGIMNNDLILVKQTEEVQNGEIVVAMIDGFESEATVKTYYNEGDHIRLQPQNSSMSPIIVKEVKVLGKVKGVFRYFN